MDPNQNQQVNPQEATPQAQGGQALPGQPIPSSSVQNQPGSGNGQLPNQEQGGPKQRKIPLIIFLIIMVLLGVGFLLFLILNLIS